MPEETGLCGRNVYVHPRVRRMYAEVLTPHIEEWVSNDEAQ